MKEGKVFKRILAIALVVVMTITMMPFGVFAEGEETTTLDAGSSEVVTPGEGETPAEPECAHIKDVDSKYQNAKSATCEENGMKAHYLCKCGVKVQYPSIDNPMVVTDEYLKIPATGHTEETLEAVESTCSSTGLTEGKKCSVCGKILVAQTVTDKKAHTEETLAAVAPTCTEEGKTEGKKCSVCNEVLVPQTPVIATGHRYGTDGKCTNAGCTETCPHSGEKVTIPGTPATCTNPGVSDGEKCKDCGAVTKIQTVIPALNHPAESVETKDAVAATCLTAGSTAGKYCKLCEKWIEGNETISALGHDVAGVAITKASETQHGKLCKREGCGVYVDLANHDYTEIIASSAATCVTEGSETAKCACGATKTSVLPKNENHDWGTWTETKAATCTDAGSRERSCKRNGCTDKDVEALAALGHTMTKTAAKAATCKEAGNIEYYTCSVCTKLFKDEAGNVEVLAADTVIAKGEHVYTKYELSADATCTAHAKETAKCDICKEATHTRDIPATMVAHTFKNYVSDNNATCVEDGTMTATCEMCKTQKDTKPEVGSKERAEHTPDKDGVRCTLCGKELVCVHTYSTEKLITKVAKCDEDGQKAIVCSKCQAHKPGSEEVIPALGHKWDEGTVTTAPTCKEKGAKLHKCENAGCDETKVEEMAIVDHDYQPVVTQPTCTEDGYTTYTCSMCKSHYVDDQVDAFGHMFDTYYYDEGSATCYQDGTKTATCSNGCGAKNTVADPGSKTDHEVTDFTVIKEATCLEEGEQEAKCFYYDKCGYSEIVPIDALGHDIPADFVTDKEPTCTEKGSKSKKCTRCSETVATEEIPALGHAVNTDYTVDVAATCLEAGKQSKHCARCDYKEGETTIPALGHDYQPAAGTEATCLEGGYAKFTCTRCADTYEEANRPALGHNFVYISDNNATCKEDGTESGKCSRCDATDTRTQVGSKLSHVLGEPVVTPATTKADGVITKTCTLCNDYNETEEIAKIAGMKLTYTVVAYDGKYKRPGLTITDANGTKLVKGEDYTLVLPTKEECSEIGTFTYTINFMGNYKGKGTISYKVVPGKAAKLVAKTTRQSYITLKWSAVKGADGYRVYVKNSKGNWKKLATVKGKNYYKVEDLKAGTEYEFAVKAYAKTDDGTVWATEYIEGAFKTLPGKTSKITYKSNKSAVKLTWKDVKGADGYRVYVYNTKTKKYTTVATVKGKTSYTVKELKAGTTYKFAVKAYYKYDGATVWSNQYTTINTKTAK